MSETQTAYRIVCHGSGQPGHQDHKFQYTDEASARKMLVKRTEEWARDRATAMCTPFHLESREISEWAEVSDSRIPHDGTPRAVIQDGSGTDIHSDT